MKQSTPEPNRTMLRTPRSICTISWARLEKGTYSTLGFLIMRSKRLWYLHQSDDEATCGEATLIGIFATLKEAQRAGEFPEE